MVPTRGGLRPPSPVVRIPESFLKEFRAEARIILRPIPGIFPVDIEMLKRLRPDILKDLGKDYEVLIVPKQQFMR
jgi:hypothetical protein